MNRDQEYIKFWIGIKSKLDEIQEDYDKLSYENKQRVDSILCESIRANTVLDAINFLNKQINR